LHNLDNVTGQMRFAIISATKDVIVPPRFQKDVISTLEKRNLAARLFEVDEGHGTAPADLYAQGLDFVMAKPGS
ncbi:MAG: hypothetical protein K2Y39_27150, partial [Candidatus Obscuribacterales bacterium]|nr:hypothetical protein [Candidatus Obscuribacterales bacterium]